MYPAPRGGRLLFNGLTSQELKDQHQGCWCRHWLPWHLKMTPAFKNLQFAVVICLSLVSSRICKWFLCSISDQGGPALKAEVKSSKMACTCTFNEVWSENTVKMGFGLWTCKCVHDIECSTQGLVNSSYFFWFTGHNDYSSNDSCWNGATFLFLLHGQVLFIGELQFGLTGKASASVYLINIGNITFHA